MSTLRETIQSKIATAETAIANWKQDLANIEGNWVGLLEQDVDAVRSKIEAVVKHLGL